MSGAGEPTITAVVVAAQDNVPLARATVRTASTDGRLRCLVIDLDGTYRPVAEEQVVPLPAAVHRLALEREASTAAATLEPGDFAFYAGVLGASYAKGAGAAVAVVLGAGVHVLSDLRALLSSAPPVMVVPFADTTSLVRRAAAAPLSGRRGSESFSTSIRGRGSVTSRAFYAVRTNEDIAVLRGFAANWRMSSSALDTFALASAATVVASPPLLVSPWRAVPGTLEAVAGRLCIQHEPVAAIDLTGLDSDRPWVLDSRAPTSPAVLLSEHPALAELVLVEARSRSDDQAWLSGDPVAGDEEPPARLRVDSILRAEARRADHVGGELPDLLGLGGRPDLTSWALALVPEGHPAPVARYLAAVRQGRPHLRQTFREVPGADASGLAQWANRNGTTDRQLDPELVTRAAEVTLAFASGAPEPATAAPRPAGVNLVGYLGGQLGIGESARLMDDALQSAGIATSTYDVGADIASRQGASFRRTDPVMYDTSLVCVNAVDTPAVAQRVRSLIQPTRVIGMWYWELEDFPASHAAGFQYVDEVWVATDFMRDAIAKHAGEIPVRTVTPPLPQAAGDPGVLPGHFGIPESRPWFLFTFDFLSSAPRKNPHGLIEAFTRAFGDLPEVQRPLLVIKTINADRSPAHAERLRLQVLGRSDVLFLDVHLDHHERHVLVSHCTAYVSLHKAEGLGLTVAEAMAWGKPVITTAYGGVTQFCHDENAFLVDWRRGYVEETEGPYVEGLPWAEPDLDQAATFMRVVVEEPDRAALVGSRAADDIREHHNVEVAGRRMREVLGQSDVEWQLKGREARARREGPRVASSTTTETFPGSPRGPGRAGIRRRVTSWRPRS